MEVEILNPVFKCESDKEIFLQRVSEIAGLRKVVDKGANLCLSVSITEERETVKALQAICDIWHTSFKEI